MSHVTSNLAEIRVPSLRAEAVRSIRAAIIRGELAAGEILSANAIALQLGVSATPVREAMIELSQDGVVEAVRNRGFRIIPMSRADLEQMLAVRLLLEVPAAGEVAGAFTADELRQLEEIVRTGEQSAGRGELADFLEHDREFHLALLQRAGNPYLTGMVLGLRDRRRLDGPGRGQDRAALVEQASHHRLLLEAIARGDRAAAEETMRRHLEHSTVLFAPETP